MTREQIGWETLCLPLKNTAATSWVQVPKMLSGTCVSPSLWLCPQTLQVGSSVCRKHQATSPGPARVRPGGVVGPTHTSGTGVGRTAIPRDTAMLHQVREGGCPARTTSAGPAPRARCRLGPLTITTAVLSLWAWGELLLSLERFPPQPCQPPRPSRQRHSEDRPAARLLRWPRSTGSIFPLELLGISFVWFSE